MGQQIEVDDDVFEALQAKAEPLVDSVNDVLRRVLEISGNGATPKERTSAENGASVSTTVKESRRRRRRKGERPRRAPKGSLLPEEEYEIPILAAILELGGKAPTSEVVELVGEKLDAKLGDIDRELIGSGDVRWRNRVQFVRLKLIQRGDMSKNSPRGTWEITPQGEKRLRESEKGE
ncbi:MAG: winged helix-turn-helix domain-containing protein [Acidimicrobiia bacterium]|nr:winged helix-turn-helix domain-containing protein [Acidimicrobiia bacterium]